MGLSTREILERLGPEWGLEIVGGQSGLCAEPLERITVMETMDFAVGASPKGLFVLTTLYTMTIDSDRTLAGIRNLFARGLAGMAIKLNRYVSEVPPEVVEWSNAYSVPVYAIRTNVLFADFIAAFAEGMLPQRDGATERSPGNFLRLAKSLSLSGTPDNVLAVLSSIVGNACCFFSTTGEVVSIIDPVHVWSDADVLQELGRSVVRRQIVEDPSAQYDWIGGLLALPCRTDSRYLGALVVGGITTLTDELEVILKQALSCIAIQRYELQVASQREAGNAGYLDEVLLKRFDNRWHVIERLASAGLVVDKQVAVVVLEPRDELNPANRRDVVEFCGALLGQVFDRVVTRSDGRRLTAVVSFGSGELGVVHVHTAIEQLRSKRLGTIRDLVDFGVSLAQADPRELPDCYEQARAAIRLGREYRPDRHLFRYEAFAVQGLIARAAGSPEYRFLHAHVVSPLQEHDRAHESHLWETLGVLFRVRSLKEAAEVLYIHISTLRYRIQRIEDLTGYDYHSPFGRYQLHTAYLVYRAERESP